MPQSILKTMVEEPSINLDFTGVEAPPAKLLAWIHQQWSAHPPSYTVGPGGQSKDVRGEPPFAAPEPQPEGAQSMKGDSAAKADDVEANNCIWDDRIWGMSSLWEKRRSALVCQSSRGPLDIIRKGLLVCWRRRLTKEFAGYMQQQHGPLWSTSPAAARDREVGRDCICCAAGADWWEWRAGSTILFWRWPRHLHSLVRDGHSIWV